MSDKESKEMESHSDEHPETEREVERKEEEREFTPVIVKRTDEALKHPDDILEKAINEGLEQLQRPFLSLLLSALAAGLILGFTAMSVAVVESQSLIFFGNDANRLSTALVYPLGFVLCIMSGTQLFTEHGLSDTRPAF